MTKKQNFIDIHNRNFNENPPLNNKQLNDVFLRGIVSLAGCGTGNFKGATKPDQEMNQQTDRQNTQKLQENTMTIFCVAVSMLTR